MTHTTDPSAERGDDRGFTLLETMITGAVLLIILSIFLGAFDVLSSTEIRIVNQSENQEVVRLAIDQMQRDIDSANPLDAAPSPGDPSVDLEVKVGQPSSGQSTVQWIYDPTAHTLTRTSGGQQSAYITNVSSFSFSYYNDQGQQFSPNTDGTWDQGTLSNIQNCTIRVHVSIVAAPKNPATPFSEDTDMELRNRLPGGILGCV